MQFGGAHAPMQFGGGGEGWAGSGMPRGLVVGGEGGGGVGGSAVWSGAPSPTALLP
jgi:hypothetical protein